MRGRKPTPSAQRRLAGNPGRRPLNEDEPKVPAAAIDKVPRSLRGDKLAETEWRRLAPLMRRVGLLTEVDRSALVALCQQWSRYQHAHRTAIKRMIVQARSGYSMPNPYIGIANKALLHCTRLWVELGLTPSARSRVTKVPMEPPADAFAEFDEIQSPARPQ
jgi:P27 family predicted phage terminase small subunit